MENFLPIRQRLEDLRKEALAQFMKEFIPLLEREGFTLDDLIDGIASYSCDMKLDQQIIIHLENAASEYRGARIADQLPKDTKSD